jgi:hypothetical protein
MAQMTVKVGARGFPLGHQPQWEMRVAVTYESDVRKDVVEFPPDGWERIRDGGSEWEMVPSQFCGGWVTAFCQTTLDGEELMGRSFNSVSIRGHNPTKARVRAELGQLSFQVVGYLESRFTQFSDEVELSRIGARREEPGITASHRTAPATVPMAMPRKVRKRSTRILCGLPCPSLCTKKRGRCHKAGLAPSRCRGYGG